MQVEDGYYLARITKDGELQTSSDIEYGWAKDEYYYYIGETKRPLRPTTWGGGGVIWGGFNGQEVDSYNQVKQKYLRFFVGPESEYKKHVAQFGLNQAGAIEH